MQGSQITNQLKPVYLLASGEVLLTRDWLDEARRALREDGFEDILNLQVDKSFDWPATLSARPLPIRALAAFRRGRHAERSRP